MSQHISQVLPAVNKKSYVDDKTGGAFPDGHGKPTSGKKKRHCQLAQEQFQGLVPARKDGKYSYMCITQVTRVLDLSKHEQAGKYLEGDLKQTILFSWCIYSE